MRASNTWGCHTHAVLMASGWRHLNRRKETNDTSIHTDHTPDWRHGCRVRARDAGPRPRHPPSSRGAVATVTTIDATTGMATLKTEEGEVFEHPTGVQWHVGHKVICDRIYAPRPRFQHCQPWESAHRDTGAAQTGLAPRR